MAKISSRPTSTYSNNEDEVGFPLKYGSGRWRNSNQVSGTRFKICLCGKKNVGKTSLFLRVQGLDFVKDNRNCAISTFEYKDPNDITVEYSVYDPETLDIDSLTFGDHYRNAHCILLVYDVTDLASLHYLNYEMEKIEKNQYTPHAKYVLVCNKVDKKASKHVPLEKQRQFLEESKLRSKLDYIVQLSAKTNEGIVDFFKEDLPELLTLPSSESKHKGFDKLLDNSFGDSVDSNGKKRKKKRKGCAQS